MTIRINDHQLPYHTHNLYDVSFFDEDILTLVTHSPSMVDSWIADIERIHRRRLHRLIVGLDAEWRPNFSRYNDNPIAILQLCVGHRCLIFQLLRAPSIPQSLVNFLANENYTFVGVGIAKDVDKLYDEYGLHVENVIDLRALAAEETGNEGLRNAGLKGLARAVLGKEIDKPRHVTMSRWDNPWLTAAQIQYACIDSFVSFEIGRICNA